MLSSAWVRLPAVAYNNTSEAIVRRKEQFLKLHSLHKQYKHKHTRTYVGVWQCVQIDVGSYDYYVNIKTLTFSVSLLSYCLEEIGTVVRITCCGIAKGHTVQCKI